MKTWETDETFLSRWLENKLTEEERKEFEASAEYEAYVKTTKDMEAFELDDYDEKSALTKLKNRISTANQTQDKVRSFRPLWYISAAAILIIGGFAIWQFLKPKPMLEIVAQERLKHALPDGSLVELRAGAIISYIEDSWLEERSVLLKGEAYFEVNTGKKFEIELEEGKVRVLGTRFNIVPKPDMLEVVCYEGKVQVEAYGKGTDLSEGESVLIVKNGKLQTDKVLLNRPVWLSSVARVKDASLVEVLEQLEKLYGVEIRGEFDKTERFNFTFPTDNLEIALMQVLGPLDLKFEMDSEGNVLVYE